MRRPFAVGRIFRGIAEIVWVEGAPAPPFPGPWRLESVVRPLSPPEDPSERGDAPGATVH